MSSISRYNVARRLELLRNHLHKTGIDAYIVNTQDAHASEYPAESDARRVYLTGFTGSAGTALVTQKEALLWTDSRYFEQAEKELAGTQWVLVKDGLPSVPTLSKWMSACDYIQTIAYDPLLMSYSGLKRLKSAFNQRDTTKKLVALTQNLVDQIWKEDGKPPPPCTATYVLHIHQNGMSAKEKINKIREACVEHNVDACVLSLLDDVAWATNLRAADIRYCPLFSAYLLITKEICSLYVDPQRLSKECLEHLDQSSITVEPYEALFPDITQLYGNAEFHGRVWLDPSVNIKLYNCIHNAEKHTLISTSPAQRLKAVKTDVELSCLREAHIKDAMSKISFLCWLENLALDPVELNKYTEYTVAEKLEEYRRQMPNCVGLSFETISSIGSNGAIVHYSPSPTHSVAMSQDMYLVDSGGQYLEGTTDVTRTLHLGNPTSQQQRIWTCVFKGHLQLARQRFPKGTVGPQLDVLCRQFLWMNGLNYLHGTGHGVGAFLNVHEGPHHISTYHKGPQNEIPLEPNMVVTNEPGYYEAGEFGVRIENVLAVKEAPLPMNKTTQEVFYEFEDLTLIPYQKKMMDFSLMTSEEIYQVNIYHQRVWDILEKRFRKCTGLPHVEKTLCWLRDATSPIVVHAN